MNTFAAQDRSRASARQAQWQAGAAAALFALTLFTLTLATAMLLPRLAAADNHGVGQPAPAFSAVDSNGKTVTLQEFAGKIVVLEWTNHDCPFVKKYYNGGAMQALQADAAAKGVVWLTVISSAKGEQGYVSGEEANALSQNRRAVPSHVLLDPDGKIGRAYGAKTTPHMFVINQQGILVYAGAIDDQPNTTGDPATARIYLREVLAALQAGKPVEVSSTPPYGCSVKYGG
jgi:peroxiredoxin